MGFVNINKMTAAIKKQIIENVAKNAVSFELKANEIVKQAVDDVEAVDSGLLQSKTFVKLKVNLNSNDLVAVNFKTQKSKYGVFVHEGLGTNRKYGRRPFLEISRQQFLDYITTGSYSPVFKTGSQYKGMRKVQNINKTGKAKK
jgi:hypothetical protein